VNCSCVAGTSTSAHRSSGNVTGSATFGVCAVAACRTWRFAIILILFMISMLILFICKIFQVSVLLRSGDISYHEKTTWMFDLKLVEKQSFNKFESRAHVA